MHKKIIVKREDGGVSIVVPSHEATPELLERDAKAVQGYLSHRILEDEHIPLDREFRNAWTDDYEGPQIDIHGPKAKEIKLDKLRRDRDQVFKQMGFPHKLHADIEKAIVSPSVAKVLKELRDVTKPLKNLIVNDQTSQEDLDKINALAKVLEDKLDV